jgi:3-dehydroquinate synthase
MPRVATVPVHIPGGASYDIIVRAGLLNDAGIVLRKLSGAAKVAVVTDSNVGPLHLAALEASLRKAEFQPIVATIPAGEQHKTIGSISSIYDAILPAKIDRNTPVIALGGGVIGDMAGFVAATLLRGVPFVQMPTTLLSMVDASVGGKTGIDHATGKNLIGAFHQPIAVMIDPQVLQTLPRRELRSGLAECIKHEIIRDAEGFAALEASIGRALSLDVAYLAELVAHNVAIKARVVEADPFEKAERAHLNLGHTYGHAIEHVSQYAYSHGESIALGMVAAAYTAANLELIDEAARRRIVGLIQQAGLPTGGMTLDPATVYQAMFFDKKVKAGKLRLVLPQGIGKAAMREDVPAELIRAAIRSLV